MIEMACPRCGAGGRVPRDKMNARLVCKKCLQVFHLKAGGVAVLGEPPVQKDNSEGASPSRAAGVGCLRLGGARAEAGQDQAAGPQDPRRRLRGPADRRRSARGSSPRSRWRRAHTTMATAITKGDIRAVMAMVLPGDRRRGDEVVLRHLSRVPGPQEKHGGCRTPGSRSRCRAPPTDVRPRPS